MVSLTELMGINDVYEVSTKWDVRPRWMPRLSLMFQNSCQYGVGFDLERIEWLLRQVTSLPMLSLSSWLIIPMAFAQPFLLLVGGPNVRYVSRWIALPPPPDIRLQPNGCACGSSTTVARTINASALLRVTRISASYIGVPDQFSDR